MTGNDERTKRDIMAFIKMVAKEYTPEWRLDEEYPDIGTALSKIYTDMFMGTIHHFNQIPLKHELSFFNYIQAKRLPAKASNGYVTFHLVNHEVKGVEVPAGAGILADTEGEPVRLETLDDVYVTPSEIRHIFYTSDSEDEIKHVFDSQEGFLRDAPNLQTHEWYFSHKEALHIEGEAWIEVNFPSDDEDGKERFDLQTWEKLTDSSYVEFEYGTEDGFVPFEGKYLEDNKLVLYKGKNQMAFTKLEVNGIENHWIRCKVHSVAPFLNLTFERMALSVRNQEMEPDMVYGAGMECAPVEYLPFGEKFSKYTEVYFASREVLSKKGADIRFSFQLNFLKIPIRDEEKEEIEYKWIMKRNGMKKEKEYEITIREVQWEYYNGKGWCRLWKGRIHGDVFQSNGNEADFIKTISFPCPNDMEPVLVESLESYYIRARIISVGNEFQYHGHYLTPVLSHATFQYRYPKEGVRPDEVMATNNGEWDVKKGSFRPFHQTGMKEPAWYFGLSSPFTDGPIKLLFTLDKQSTGDIGKLRWEYYGKDSFREIDVIDETNHFNKTGLVTFMGRKDFGKKRLFGKELYWIRMVDQSGRDTKSWNGYRPFIQGIHLNSVRVEARRKRKTEWFAMGLREENKAFPLSEQSVMDIDVWVNESKESLDGQEGNKEALTMWKEVEDFATSTPLDRHYMVDRIQGVIRFGNGRNGNMPPASGRENIKVVYRHGGGACTNLEAGSDLKLERGYGFIHNATNVEPIGGGKDPETTGGAIRRSSLALKHRNRAVTEGDYEELAREASSNVLHVQCFGNRDEKGGKRPGYVTLVVVSRDMGRDLACFEETRNEILFYFKEKVEEGLLASGRLKIVEPHYLVCNVNGELLVNGLESAFSAKREAEKQIGEYINQLQIGEVPTLMQFKNILKRIPNVTLVRNLRSSLAEYETNEACLWRFVLNGTHGISAIVKHIS